jgi:hypothetical protein
MLRARHRDVVGALGHNLLCGDRIDGRRLLVALREAQAGPRAATLVSTAVDSVLRDGAQEGMPTIGRLVRQLDLVPPVAAALHLIKAVAVLGARQHLRHRDVVAAEDAPGALQGLL